MKHIGDLMRNQKNISRFSLFVLVYNVLVILFGAYVRASGSGAGCGQNWPLCNGVIVPINVQIETIIEFTHRFTSGFSLILLFILFVWVFKIYPAGNRIRKAAVLALIFVILEAIVGAGLVLFQLVKDNDSVARAIVIAFHLINTYFLLGSILLVYIWSKNGPEFKLPAIRLSKIFIIFVTIGLLILGSSGAITALGDTIFPSGSLSEGLLQDFDNANHFLIQLRIYHPLIAVFMAFIIYALIKYSKKIYTSKQVIRYANLLMAGFVGQIFVGTLNILLLAPIWMQIIHLLVADLIWLTYILFVNQVLVDYS